MHRHDDNLENHMVLPQAEEPDPEAFDELEFDAYRDNPRDTECDHEKAFNDWLVNSAAIDVNKVPIEMVGILRNTFFAGASYGMDQISKVYRGENDE